MTGSPHAAEAAAQARQGFDLLNQNQLPQAESAFRKAIELAPENSEAHRGLGLTLWSAGKSREALQELNTAIRLDPDDAEAHLALGRIAWALSSQPTPDASARAGDSYRSMAIAELTRAAGLRPKDFDIRATLAQALLDAGRAHDALAQANQALTGAVSPAEQARGHVLAGRADEQSGDEAAAEAEFRAALAADPNQAEVHFELGALRIKQKRLPQAEEEFREAIRIDPHFGPAYGALAEILDATGKTPEARDNLEKAVALDPQDWQSRYRLGKMLLAAGQGARAAELFQQVARMNPGFLPAREQLGLALLRRGDTAGASLEAENLLAANPQAVEGHRLMALVLWRKRDLEGSLAECAMALGTDPNSVAMMALESLELWQLERRKEARDTFAAAGKLEPRLGTAEVFCRQISCEARDIGPVEDFLRKNRWVLAPPLSPE